MLSVQLHNTVGIILCNQKRCHHYIQLYVYCMEGKSVTPYSGYIRSLCLSTTFSCFAMPTGQTVSSQQPQNCRLMSRNCRCGDKQSWLCCAIFQVCFLLQWITWLVDNIKLNYYGTETLRHTGLTFQCFDTAGWTYKKVNNYFSNCFSNYQKFTLLDTWADLE